MLSFELEMVSALASYKAPLVADVLKGTLSLVTQISRNQCLSYSVMFLVQRPSPKPANLEAWEEN